MNPQQPYTPTPPNPTPPQTSGTAIIPPYYQGTAPQATPQPVTPQPTPQYPQQPQPAPTFATPQPASQPFVQQPQPTANPQLIQQLPTPQSPQVTAQNAPLVQVATPARVPDNPNSTQSTLLISELRDGLVIMKDGSFRAVVASKSINFDLMSSTEREGIEYSYQNFINSLTFPTQILIRSQRVDIGPYIERLSDIRKNNDNMLLGVLMDDYINFIDVLSQEANIMDKSFFIIIPYYTSEETERITEQTKNFFSIFRKSTNTGITKIDRPTYNKAVSEINNRVESVISGLFQIGIHSIRLNTRELSELYYNFNNPDTAVREPFIDFSKMATTYVRKDNNAQPKGTN